MYAVFRHLSASLALFAMLFAAASAQAAPQGDSLADTKVVLQISDPNPFKQTLVLNVAGNLIKHYGPDLVDIEVVAFGPGLRLLFEGNANTPRVQSLAASGVRFSACSNTIRNMGKKIGNDPALLPQSVPVSAGVVRIIELQNQGYMLIKP